LILFLLSALFRLLVSLALLPSVREVREVPPLVARDFFVGIAQMRPLSGFKFDLFIPGRRRRVKPTNGVNGGLPRAGASGDSDRKSGPPARKEEIKA
jgi:hypothetical protein